MYSEDKPDPNRFDMLAHFDFPEDHKGESIVQYEYEKMTLYDIFESYGTEVKPKEDPRLDPLPPEPKSPTKIPDPTPPRQDENKDEEEKEGEDGNPEEPESPTKFVEEEPEEVFIPPDDRVMWYDFDTFDGKDPVLLALMHRGINDTFTI